MSASPFISTQGPPYSVHSERIVVASLVKDPTLLSQVVEILPDPSALYNASHERQYRAMIELLKQDPPSSTAQLIESLDKSDCLKSVGGTATLRQLAQEGLSRTPTLDHARNLAEKARMRQLIEALADLLNESYRNTDGYSAMLNNARQRLASLSDD